MASAAAFIVVASGILSSFRDGPPPELPPMLRYEPPEFPAELRASATLDGEATAAFTVDADGDVTDVVVLAASQPAFAASLEAAVKVWRLRPQSSTTTPRREVVRFIFRRTGKVSSLTHFDAASAAFQGGAEQEFELKTLMWEQLVDKPTLVQGVPPVYPPALKKNGAVGHATVSYVIDREGRVRIPVVVSATHAELGTAASQAVTQWRFTPARHDGRTVLVQDARTFQFGVRAPSL